MVTCQFPLRVYNERLTRYANSVQVEWVLVCLGSNQGMSGSALEIIESAMQGYIVIVNKSMDELQADYFRIRDIQDRENQLHQPLVAEYFVRGRGLYEGIDGKLHDGIIVVDSYGLERCESRGTIESWIKNPNYKIYGYDEFKIREKKNKDAINRGMKERQQAYAVRQNVNDPIENKKQIGYIIKSQKEEIEHRRRIKEVEKKHKAKERAKKKSILENF